MPWYDPYDNPEWYDYCTTRRGSLMDLSWLRKNAPRERTSTWKQGSATAILGEAGEVVVVGRIQNILEDLGLSWKVGRTGTPNSRVKEIDLGPCPEDDIWTPIENSRMGDVHVVDHRGKRRVSFEVKASMEYENATISCSELENSEAEYLVGVTKAGLWVCSMAEARKHAYERHGIHGSFYIVPYDRVEKVQLREVILRHKRPRKRSVDRW
jgi:hypothetical protein